MDEQRRTGHRATENTERVRFKHILNFCRRKFNP